VKRKQIQLDKVENLVNMSRRTSIHLYVKFCKKQYGQQTAINKLSEYIHIYTVGHKKTYHFYFYNNFGKCGPISIILSLLDSQTNCGI